jgi:hypothetical protein
MWRVDGGTVSFVDNGDHLVGGSPGSDFTRNFERIGTKTMDGDSDATHTS